MPEMTTKLPYPQHQPAFITHLPREVRDRIYLELWRSCGLRQHIVWHRNKEDKAKSHFCRWRCTTPFSLEDELQELIDATRIQLGIPLGDSFSNKPYALQLSSAWKNHFACGQRIARVYGEDADPGIRTCYSLGPCWSSHELSSEKLSTCSPYLSMLLSCKVLSSECLESIYESTTFIFTDIFALNTFIGFCKVPELLKEEVKVAISPPAFRTFGRHLEIFFGASLPYAVAVLVAYAITTARRASHVSRFPWASP
ncbi:hypothetical protein FOVG_07067 [Fusarium oxysporum f. sp. pisi HDV247]|uniref:Uncharacterized protein n=1 Tax=Fusarium oxysporum f. sp. pisi HDV247 TaxID=1080344 RepID=W9PTN0_FUSOX|nr:hypothetical protein FOVG_07067 [Fusarium oxysporum f. sp. pisi HDV247]